MPFSRIKSHAKLNLALNVISKSKSLHNIESIISFVDLHDIILIKEIKSKKHLISFNGKFSRRIGKKNTVSKLFEILEKKKILKNQRFQIKIKKSIPDKAGLGGGSMNAASILRYLAHKRIINIKNEEILKISKLIGSDVMLGLNHKSKILNSRNKIKYFNNVKKIYPLIVKPNFGCSTKDIYSKVRKFDKAKFGKGAKKMFDINFLKEMKNSLETIAFLKYPRLKNMKLYLENSLNPVFVRMTGSGSGLVAYFQTKKRCERAKKRFIQKYKNIWCIASKTI